MRTIDVTVPRPRIVATRVADPNPWRAVDAPMSMVRNGSVDLRWKSVSGKSWNQAGATASASMLATTDEREARVAFAAFAQAFPGMSALYQTAEGVHLLDMQQVWDKDAVNKRNLPDPFIPTLVDPFTGALAVQVQRRHPSLVAVRGDGVELTWTPVHGDPDDFWSMPGTAPRERFRTPTAASERPRTPAIASASTPIATVEYTNPFDSTRRKRESLYVDESRIAWVGDRPDDAVAAARALATRAGLEVAVWREGDGAYWLFPIFDRDRHMPVNAIDAPNGVMRTSHPQLQAIIGAGAAFDPHGLVQFNGPDDPDEPWRDSYLQPGDPRLPA